MSNVGIEYKSIKISEFVKGKRDEGIVRESECTTLQRDDPPSRVRVRLGPITSFVVIEPITFHYCPSFTRPSLVIEHSCLLDSLTSRKQPHGHGYGHHDSNHA